MTPSPGPDSTFPRPTADTRPPLGTSQISAVPAVQPDGARRRRPSRRPRPARGRKPRSSFTVQLAPSRSRTGVSRRHQQRRLLDDQQAWAPVQHCAGGTLTLGSVYLRRPGRRNLVGFEKFRTAGRPSHRTVFSRLDGARRRVHQAWYSAKNQLTSPKTRHHGHGGLSRRERTRFSAQYTSFSW